MSRAQFFDWAQAQDARYEFDGFQPVAMPGGNINHNQLAFNIHVALRSRLRGTGCRPFGQDAGIATVGETVRYPDGLVTCTPTRGDDHLVPGVVVVFEVVSPTSGRTDRIIKVREYAAVASILRYVILESSSIGLTVLERQPDAKKWTASTLTSGETLPLPELGIEIPVAELYEDVDFSSSEAETAPGLPSAM